jgi:hypothetical protein
MGIFWTCLIGFFGLFALDFFSQFCSFAKFEFLFQEKTFLNQYFEPQNPETIFET